MICAHIILVIWLVTEMYVCHLTSAFVFKKITTFGIELGSLEVKLVAIPEGSSCITLSEGNYNSKIYFKF